MTNKTNTTDKTRVLIQNNKELLQRINANYQHHPDAVQSFIDDAKKYIKAISDGRMLCVIGSVSTSGMSRTIFFSSFEPLSKKRTNNGKTGYYRTYYSLFKSLGFSQVKNSDYFRVHGCGMDMVFHTNYTIIHKFKYLGIIKQNQCDHLAQQTPNKF